MIKINEVCQSGHVELHMHEQYLSARLLLTGRHSRKPCIQVLGCCSHSQLVHALERCIAANIVSIEDECAEL